MDDKAVYRQNVLTVRAERGLPLLSGNGPRGRRVPTAGTSSLRKADVPVFFDNILITSRRDTLKQDNTMVTGSYKNQGFNTGRYTLAR